MDFLNVEDNETIVLPGNTFAKEGYTFKVWADSLENVKSFLDILFGNTVYLTILGVAGAVLLFIALRLMFAGTGKKEKPDVQPVSTLVKASELGSTFISLQALDAMVQKFCRNNNRIRTIASSVRAVRDGGITVSVRLALMPDTDIPELTETLQTSLKQYIEKLSGILVREVGILIEDTSISPKSRVD